MFPAVVAVIAFKGGGRLVHGEYISTFLDFVQDLFYLMRIMVEKPDYRGLIQPVTGLSEAAQRELLAPYEPSEVYVCRTAEDFDNYLKQMRPPRVALVAYAGVLGEQRGNKEGRVENLIAMKVAIHKRGCHVVEVSRRDDPYAGRRDSRVDWATMKRDGEEMCRRLAQGRRSALNGRKGAEPYEFTNEQLVRFALEMSKSYPAKKAKTDPTPDDRRIAKIAAYCKQQKKEAPRRSWLKQKLPALMRERNLG